MQRQLLRTRGHDAVAAVIHQKRDLLRSVAGGDDAHIRCCTVFLFDREPLIAQHCQQAHHTERRLLDQREAPAPRIFLQPRRIPLSLSLSQIEMIELSEAREMRPIAPCAEKTVIVAE